MTRIKKARLVGPVAGAALVVAAVWVAVNLRTAAPPPADVILITVETLRADHVSMGDGRAAETPHMERLAAAGTYFTQAVTPMPRTTPAVASLLTGLWPHHHGSREVGDAMLAGTTLAQVLQARGYRTLAVSANPAAGPQQNLDRGFDRFVGGRELQRRYGHQFRQSRAQAARNGFGPAQAVTREALSLVQEVPADQRLFLWVFYFDPHFFYQPPAPWGRQIEAPACREIYRYLNRHREAVGRIFNDIGGVASRALGDCRKLYAAEIAYTDSQIGGLLAGLERLGRRTGSLIVLTADHGENLGEGGLFFEHGENVRDAALRVPLALVGPGVAQGRVDSGAVSLVDVMPTLLSLLGLAEAERPAMDGRQLAARLLPEASGNDTEAERIVFVESASALWNEGFQHLVTGRTEKRRVCINGRRYTLCESPHEQPGVYSLFDHSVDPDLSRNLAVSRPEEVGRLLAAWRRWPPESARYRAARTSRFKLVQSPRLEGGYAAALYDLEHDPAERTDVRSRYPEVFQRLQAALDEWAAQLPVTIRRQEDPELEETLRSLGYLP